MTMMVTGMLARLNLPIPRNIAQARNAHAAHLADSSSPIISIIS